LGWAVIGDLWGKAESRKQKAEIRLVEGGFEEAAGLGLDGGELGFEVVADGHQFVHFGDDKVLLSECAELGF
jgi:hypothetical protein